MFVGVDGRRGVQTDTDASVFICLLRVLCRAIDRKHQH